MSCGMVVVFHQANFQFPGHSEKVGFVDHESRIILPWGDKKYDTVSSHTGLKKALRTVEILGKRHELLSSIRTATSRYRQSIKGHCP